MLINQNTAISTSQILLVPYCKHHVPTYHQWMQDPGLQAATASEPLSLAEEYSMQSGWRHDADKLTFIACLPVPSCSTPTSIISGTHDTPSHMLGDINLFLFLLPNPNHNPNPNPPPPSSSSSAPLEPCIVVGELEIMIARPGAQGNGYGKAALRAFLKYVAEHQEEILKGFLGGRGEGERGMAYLRVRIQERNVRSLSLFEGVGFRRAGDGKPNWFGEVELRREVGVRGEGEGDEDGDGWREVRYEGEEY